MATTRDDSVLTSIHELQRLEDERVRETARREQEAERARLAKLEAARAEADRLAAERIASAEAERVAEERAREARERAAHEARDAREIHLRAEAERERALRAEERREAHARAMAEIEARHRPGMRGGVVVALVCAALGVIAVAGYYGAWRPMAAAQDARIAELRARAERADHERESARIAQERLAERIRTLADRPSPTSSVAAHPMTPTPPRVSAPAVRRATPRGPEAQAPIEIDGDGVDPFAMDDGAHPTSARRTRR